MNAVAGMGRPTLMMRRGKPGVVTFGPEGPQGRQVLTSLYRGATDRGLMAQELPHIRISVKQFD